MSYWWINVLYLISAWVPCITCNSKLILIGIGLRVHLIIFLVQKIEIFGIIRSVHLELLDYAFAPNKITWLHFDSNCD